MPTGMSTLRIYTHIFGSQMRPRRPAPFHFFSSKYIQIGFLYYSELIHQDPLSCQDVFFIFVKT